MVNNCIATRSSKMFRHASKYLPKVTTAVLLGGVGSAAYVYHHNSATATHNLLPSFSSLLAFCEPSVTATATATATATEAKIEKIHTIEHILEQYRPDSSQYERVDHVIFEEDDLYKTWREQHALYTSLHGESRIEAYEIYRSKTSEEIYCVIKFGDKINGWPNIVHGGITALILDNTYGWLFTTFKKPKAVTANLSINYR